MIGFTHKGRPAQEAQITALERALGFELPQDYRQFVLASDGATPETNVFRIGAENESGVNQFIPIISIVPEKSLLVSELPNRCFPIAWAEGGNYVCLQIQNGTRVLFWDHEVPNRPTVLADSFTAFLELLRPFDVISIELKPKQVVGVWVSPKLKKFQTPQ
jgi:hypothetical protein